MPLLLSIEFLDELVFGAREAAWPLIRDDIGLGYVQVGILLALPIFVANLIEAPLAFLADSARRKSLILAGGVVFIASLLLTAVSQDFWVLLAAFMLFGPASGAFVSFSQATLADRDPARLEQNMARWTFAGSLGVLSGSLAVGAAASQEISWRITFLASAVLAAAAVALASRSPIGTAGSSSERQTLLATLTEGLAWALAALRRPDIIRWLVLLELSDLVGDILLGYLALYLVDIGGASPAEAAIGVAVWTVAALVGDLLVVILLERMRGLTYLRLNSAASLVFLVTFLLVPDLRAKVALAGVLGFALGGRYAILQAQLYGALPERSASILALNNASNLVRQLATRGDRRRGRTMGTRHCDVAAGDRAPGPPRRHTARLFHRPGASAVATAASRRRGRKQTGETAA